MLSVGREEQKWANAICPSLTDGENEAQRGEVNCSVLKGYRASVALRKAQIFAWIYLKISTFLFFVLLKLLASFAEDLLECENGSRCLHYFYTKDISLTYGRNPEVKTLESMF